MVIIIIIIIIVMISTINNNNDNDTCIYIYIYKHGCVYIHSLSIILSTSNITVCYAVSYHNYIYDSSLSLYKVSNVLYKWSSLLVWLSFISLVSSLVVILLVQYTMLYHIISYHTSAPPRIYCIYCTLYYITFISIHLRLRAYTLHHVLCISMHLLLSVALQDLPRGVDDLYIISRSYRYWGLISYRYVGTI